MAALILSNVTFQIRLILFLAGLISLKLGFFSKFSLWFFILTKQFVDSSGISKTCFLLRNRLYFFFRRIAVGKHSTRECFPQPLTTENMINKNLNTAFSFVSICVCNFFHLLIVIQIFLNSIFRCLPYCFHTFLY